MRARVLWLGIPVIMAAILMAVFSTGQSVPQLINYQGRLLNSSGQPLDGVTVDLTFSLTFAEVVV